MLVEAFGSRRFTSLPGRQICGLHFEGSMISTVDTCPDVRVSDHHIKIDSSFSRENKFTYVLIA